MKNMHLLPVNVIDLVEKLNRQDISENEMTNYVMRIEAIRDYCAVSLSTYSSDKKSTFNRHSRVGKKNL